MESQLRTQQHEKSHQKQIKAQLKQLKQQQKQLKAQKKQLKLQLTQLKKQRTAERKQEEKCAASLLAGLSPELKHRLAEQVRQTSPNHLLWLRDWFFGPTSLAGAEWLLRGDQRNRAGAYLLCEGRKQEFTLSVLCPADGGARSGEVRHYRVRRHYGYRIASGCAFDSLQDLIDYYSERKRKGCVQLGRPCAMPRTREYAHK